MKEKERVLADAQAPAHREYRERMEMGDEEKEQGDVREMGGRQLDQHHRTRISGRRSCL